MKSYFRFQAWEQTERGRIDDIIKQMRPVHYTFPGSFKRSAKRAQKVAKLRGWINKAKLLERSDAVRDPTQPCAGKVAGR